jgi:hypothetical protein
MTILNICVLVDNVKVTVASREQVTFAFFTVNNLFHAVNDLDGPTLAFIFLALSFLTLPTLLPVSRSREQPAGSITTTQLKAAGLGLRP